MITSLIYICTFGYITYVLPQWFDCCSTKDKPFEFDPRIILNSIGKMINIKAKMFFFLLWLVLHLRSFISTFSVMNIGFHLWDSSLYKTFQYYHVKCFHIELGLTRRDLMKNTASIFKLKTCATVGLVVHKNEWTLLKNPCFIYFIWTNFLIFSVWII